MTPFPQYSDEKVSEADDRIARSRFLSVPNNHKLFHASLDCLTLRSPVL